MGPAMENMGNMLSKSVHGFQLYSITFDRFQVFITDVRSIVKPNLIIITQHKACISLTPY